MTHQSTIPLIHASVCDPVFHVAKEIGTPIEKILRSVSLSSEILYNPFLRVPEISTWKMLELISYNEGEELLGLMAAQRLAIYNIKSLTHLTHNCINLKSVLERYCLIAPQISSNAQYLLEIKEDIVWFSYRGQRLIPNAKQVEQFQVSHLMQLVQMLLGEQWRPDEIRFTFPYCPQVEKAEPLNPSKIFFSCKHPSIAIPRNLLATKLPNTLKQKTLNVPPNILKLNESLEGSLLHLITPYLGENKISAKVIEDITGMSMRTLQRKLSESGSSYSAVLDQARFQKAEFLLMNTNENLLNISLMLGYENASSFSRSFKRLSGVSPLEYRRH